MNTPIKAQGDNLHRFGKIFFSVRFCGDKVNTLASMYRGQMGPSPPNNTT